MVYKWKLNYSKCSLYYRILLSIKADLNDTAICMVSILPLSWNSPSLHFFSLNTNIQTRKRKLCTYTYSMNSKAQPPHTFKNKRWIKNALNCEAYSNLEWISFDDRIVSAKIRVILHRNNYPTCKSLRYDWFSLANSDGANQYSVSVRNRSVTLQEMSEL